MVMDCLLLCHYHCRAVFWDDAEFWNSFSSVDELFSRNTWENRQVVRLKTPYTCVSANIWKETSCLNQVVVLCKIKIKVRISDLCNYIKPPVNRTLKGNDKQFDLARNSSYRSKFQWNFDQGKGNLVWVSGEFELSEFELWRFYYIPGVSNRWNR